MRHEQRLWYLQARADWQMFEYLRSLAIRRAGCFELLFLQMAAEKLGKAFFWRSGKSPPLSHASFVPFLRAIRRRRQLCAALGEPVEVTAARIDAALVLAYQIERLAPQLAGEGPNPEYPWPTHAPTETPVAYGFDILNVIETQTKGRQLVALLRQLFDTFERWA